MVRAFCTSLRPGWGLVEWPQAGANHTERNVADLEIIYILSAGRSGSTLLNCLLRRPEGVVAPGEIGLVWQRFLTPHYVCDCGTRFIECAFWRDVLRRAVRATSPATVQRLNQTHWKLTGLRALPGLLRHRSADSMDAEHREYLQQLTHVYEEISKLSGCPIIIDASKRPLHALLLSMVPSLKVHYIHLVRDSRAVVHSFLQRQKRSAHYLAARWMIINLVCELVVRRRGRHLFMRYEDLCRNPGASLSAIGSFVGSLGPTAADLNSQAASPCTVVFNPGHGIGGDKIRLRRGAVKISANQEWRAKMKPGDRRVVTALTWPLLARYGYTRV